MVVYNGPDMTVYQNHLEGLLKHDFWGQPVWFSRPRLGIFFKFLGYRDVVASPGSN